VPEPSEIERDFQQLTTELRKLEGEYNMYFAGRLPRPPWETRGRVDQMFKRWDRRPLDTVVTRFRLQTLQSRYSSFVDLWDRAMRAREEGRQGPLRPRQQPVDEERQPSMAVVHTAAFADPRQEMDKLQALYDALMDARRTAGDEVVPFHKFAELVREHVSRLRTHGAPAVSFKVTTVDGKVNLTAKAERDAQSVE